jgi:F1F0 ATPase subunit 2
VNAQLCGAALAFAAGLLLGAMYFGGLRATVAQMSGSPARAAGLLLVSFLVRAALLLGGLYLVCGTHWERYLAALAGITCMRIAFVYFFAPNPAERACSNAAD